MKSTVESPDIIFGGGNMDRIDIKTTENQLKQEFIQGYGYPPRVAEALVNCY